MTKVRYYRADIKAFFSDTIVLSMLPEDFEANGCIDERTLTEE